MSSPPAGVMQVPSLSGAANGRNAGRLLMKSLYRVRTAGEKAVPRKGRVIFAANHLGFLDGPLLFSMAPRPMHLLSKAQLYQPPLDRVLRSVGQIELHYDSADRDAMMLAVRMLEEGRAVGVFPEAHRGRGDFARIRHGIAYLHSRTMAPIVPVALFGTRATGMGKDELPKARSPLAVVFGEPFSVPALGDIDSRATLAAMGESIRQQLADHVARSAATYGLELPDDEPRDKTVGNG